MGQKGRQKGQASRLKIKRRYISGEQFRWDWREADVREFIAAYIDLREAGLDGPGIIADLAKLFKRNQVEVAVLIMDMGERGYIGPAGRGTNYRRFQIVDCE